MIITGTGRSGTKYIHSVLTSLGLDMGIHEKSPGKHGGVGGYRVLTNIWTGLNGPIFTQIRHPLDTVRSSLGSTNLIDYPELNLYRKNHSEVGYLIRAWLFMNKKLAGMSDLVYTLDDLNDGLVSKEFKKHLGYNYSIADINLALERNRTSEKMNIRPKKEIPNSLEFKESEAYRIAVEFYEKHTVKFKEYHR